MDKLSPEMFRGLFRKKESEQHPPLAAQYKTLQEVYKRIDTLIPRQVDFFDKQNKGKRSVKEKEFNPVKSIEKLRESVKGIHPNPDKQAELVQKYNAFLVGIGANIEPADPDTIPLGELERFLVRFPANLFDGLGLQKSTTTCGGILDIGIELARKHAVTIKGYSQKLGKQHFNYDIGKIAELVGEKIPKVIAKLSPRNPEILTTLALMAQSLSVREFDHYVDYIIEPRQISPKAKERLDFLDRTIGSLNTSNIPNKSPFALVDREGWREEISMGMEDREPQWADLVSMIRCTEEDRREYGLKITNSTDKTKAPRLAYNRGSAESVYNREPNGGKSTSNEAVFFHAHPAHILQMEAFSPLISQGDILATQMQNYGGGYLNVVGINGATLHVGAGATEHYNGNAFRYTVESGPYNQELMSPHKWEGDTVSIMARLLQLKQPYYYSIQEPNSDFKYYFMHLPWESLDKSISLQDMCFNQGLKDAVERIPDSPAIDFGSNLDEAMDKTHQYQISSSKRRFEELKRATPVPT